MSASVAANLFDAFERRDASLLRESVCTALAAPDRACILHPLGFYHIRIAAREATRIRVHYWPVGEREHGSAITPYHDHVWSLCSCVLVGSVRNVLLDIREDGSGDYQIASIDQSDGVDAVKPSPTRVQSVIRSQETHSAGTFYEVEPRVFHYTDVPPDQAALTVVRAETVIEGGPRTLVPVGYPGQAPSRDPLVSSRDVLDEIAQLLDASKGGA